MAEVSGAEDRRPRGLLPKAAPAVAEAASTEAAPAEPAMIEVWRPGRPPGQHRPAHQRKGGNQGNRDGAQQGRGPRGEARTDAAAGAPAEGGRPEFRRDRPENGGRRPPRDDQRRERRPEGEGAQARGDRRDDQRQGNRPPRVRIVATVRIAATARTTARIVRTASPRVRTTATIPAATSRSIRIRPSPPCSR